MILSSKNFSFSKLPIFKIDDFTSFKKKILFTCMHQTARRPTVGLCAQPRSIACR